MVKAGDRIRLSSGKGPDREGVVTAVMGSMVRVRWPSGGETTVIPAPGTLTVLASSGAQAPAAMRPERAVRTNAVGKAVAEKAAPKKSAAKAGATKAKASKTAAGKKSTGAEKAKASKKAASKKSTGKPSSR
jgi:hypothetical protein